MPSFYLNVLQLQAFSSLNDLRRLLGVGETDGVPSQVVDRDVLAQERITDDPKRADRRWNVHSGERRDARSTSIQHVVLALEDVIFAGESERQVGKRSNSVAVDSVCAVPGLGSSDPASKTSTIRPQICGLDLAHSLLSISATSEGMTIREVPVSIAAPVFSSSSSSSPKPIFSSSTSQ